MQKNTTPGKTIKHETGTTPDHNVSTAEAFANLETGVLAALETYSNVHRGSGHFSVVTSYLYEQARLIILEYLGLNKQTHVVIFCTAARTDILKNQLLPEDFKSISSKEIGLSLGVTGLAVNKKALPHGTPFQTGGGTARLLSPDWIVWAKSPDRFEAGTPPVINVIAFARAIKLTIRYGNKIFLDPDIDNLTALDILYHDEFLEWSGRELLHELRRTMIGNNILVPTTEGLRQYINLDNSASTPSFKPVWTAVCQTLHHPALQKDILQEVVSICSSFLGAPVSVYDLIFTSNTTEAINIAAQSLMHEAGNDAEPVIINTLLEHSSNDLPWRVSSLFPLIRLSVDDDGFIDMNELEKYLRDYNQKCLYGKKRIRLIAISGASNVLGVYNNLEEISRMAHLYGAMLFVDGAQMVAHRRVEMERYGIDFLAFSAHKDYAPFGTGALVARKGLLNLSETELKQIHASGEENIIGIAALGKALVLLQRIGMDIIQKEEQSLTRTALLGLQKVPGLTIYGIKDPYSAKFMNRGGIIAFSMKGIFSDKIARQMSDGGGIGIRYGCHCAHILVKHILGLSPSLERFQRFIVTLFPKLKLPGVARVSFGIGNSEAEIETLIRELKLIADKTPHQKNKAKLIKKHIDQFVGESARRVYA